jgi:hypothetical protein
VQLTAFVDAIEGCAMFGRLIDKMAVCRFDVQNRRS